MTITMTMTKMMMTTMTMISMTTMTAMPIMKTITTTNTTIITIMTRQDVMRKTLRKKVIEDNQPDRKRWGIWLYKGFLG